MPGAGCPPAGTLSADRHPVRRPRPPLRPHRACPSHLPLGHTGSRAPHPSPPVTSRPRSPGRHTSSSRPAGHPRPLATGRPATAPAPRERPHSLVPPSPRRQGATRTALAPPDRGPRATPRSSSECPTAGATGGPPHGLPVGESGDPSDRYSGVTAGGGGRMWRPVAARVRAADAGEGWVRAKPSDWHGPAIPKSLLSAVRRLRALSVRLPGRLLPHTPIPVSDDGREPP